MMECSLAIRFATQSPKRIIHVIPTILECPVHPSADIRPSSAQGRYKALERARLNLPVAVATQQPCARPSLSEIGIAQQERNCDTLMPGYAISPAESLLVLQHVGGAIARILVQLWPNLVQQPTAI